MTASSQDQHEAETVSPFYIAATSDMTATRPQVLKLDDMFAVLDRFGSAQASGPGSEGLFFEDTRYLSQLLLTVDNARPLFLSSSVSADGRLLTADLTNPDLIEAGDIRLPRNTVHILGRTMLTGSGLSQVVTLHNFGVAPVSLSFQFAFDADFADIFEVRGSVRPKRGVREPERYRPNGVDLVYVGLDHERRATHLAFDPTPDSVTARRAEWRLRLNPGEERTIAVEIGCERSHRINPTTVPVSARDGAQPRSGARSSLTDIRTSNPRFDDWLNRSRADIDMLVSQTPQGAYAYAGVPWFSTAFGRDGIVTALECLWLDPGLAAGTLDFLAANQATEFDPRADSEPGKILHETRKGEMAVLGEVPFGRYYGSVDATPLFIVLAAAYHGRTGDTERIRRLWPHIEAALAWMHDSGDLDGDGLLEYDRKSVNGLINQGWKDSADSIFHDDGSLADAPIALAEVQAYAYEAYLGAARIAIALGDAARAGELEAAAARLKDRFDPMFWIPELGTYALALDGRKRPCRVKSSNAGHVLFGGLATPQRAETVAATLTAPDSFSGWGIRTIAEGAPRYNPLSYHDGSVWPHDNALIAMGFGRYRLTRPLLQVMTALFETSQFTELNRLPELFCGFPKRPAVGPTAYPVACVPQAWSSAAVFGMLGAALGISFDVDARRILLTRPVLPAWIDECRIENLQIGDATAGLLLRRTGDEVAVEVLRREGTVEIAVTT